MKKMNSKIAVMMVLLCFAFVKTSIAQAQKDSQPKEPPTFTQLLKEMDANKDGKLAKSEIKGPLKNDFDKVDLNEDGFVSEEEFKKAPKPKGRKPRNKE